MSPARLAPAIALIVLEALFAAEARRPDLVQHEVISRIPEQRPSADALANSDDQSEKAGRATMGAQKVALGLEAQVSLAAFHQRLEAQKTAEIQASPALEAQKTVEVQAAPGLDRLAQLFSVNSSRLPELAKHAVMVHPSGALSLAVLDLAFHAANASGLDPQQASGAVRELLQASSGPVNFLLSASSGDVGEDLADTLAAMVFAFVLALGVFLAALVLYTCGYKAYVTNQRPEFPEPVPSEVSMESSENFQNSILSCLCPGSACLFGLCCPCIRHADTLAAAGLGSFWTTVFIWLFIDSASGALAVVVFGNQGATLLVQGVLLAIVFGSRRAILRGKFGSPSQDWRLMDGVCWALFPVCSAVQEGLEVDDAQGVDVRCLCRLYDRATGELVGESVKSES